MSYEEIKKKYEKFGQEHVLKYVPGLPKPKKVKFLKQLEKYDLEYLQKIFKASTETCVEVSNKISPAPSNIIHDLSNKVSQQIKDELFKEGLDHIKNGRVGVMVLSGGQATRLGYNKPKGMFPRIGLPSEKTLFQIQAERINRLQVLSSGEIHWYIMTSESNDQDIRVYFKDRKYFGLKPEQVHFFSQGHLPCFSNEGKLILANRFSLQSSPNGNGAVYKALKVNKMIDDMKSRGIKYIYSHHVDNVLAKPADPLLIAKCAQLKCDFGSKVLPKKDPHEKVGVYVIKNGKYHVIEYSEITKEMAEQKKENSDELLYNEGSIGNFFYSVDFLEKCATYEWSKYHVSRKKIQTINGNGDKKKTIEGIKLELYNFDVVELTDKIALCVGVREEEFSPLKTGSGGPYCTPEDCQRDLASLHSSWIEKAGGKIVGRGENGEGLVEISPLVSYMGEGLEATCKGKTFTCPVHLDKCVSLQKTSDLGDEDVVDLKQSEKKQEGICF